MFKLEIGTANAVFDVDPGEEIGRILQKVHADAVDISSDQIGRSEGVCRDINGHVVGRWEYIPEG